MTEYTCPDCGAIVPVLEGDDLTDLVCENCGENFDGTILEALAEMGPEMYHDDGCGGEDEEVAAEIQFRDHDV